MPPPTELPRVIHVPLASRFEMLAEGYTAVLEYKLQGDTIEFTHTGVPAELEGRGIGSQLAHTALDYARQHSLKVISSCWFVTGYIERHKEYQDLLKD